MCGTCTPPSSTCLASITNGLRSVRRVSISNVPESSPPRWSTCSLATAGDPKRGEQIFYKHPGTPPACSAIPCEAQGSAVGPALDGISTRHNCAAYIKQSLLEPNAVLAKGFEYLGCPPCLRWDLF